MSVEEMGLIFALIRLAWPNAPVFHNGKLDATIRLWTLCLPEVDFRTGQMAMIQLCRTCHYPPSIAQMREAAETVREQLEGEIDAALLSIRNRCYCGGIDPDRIARTISIMGGEERLLIPVDGHTARYNIEAFREAYWRTCQEETQREIQALYPPENLPKRLP